ncbi:hypothetical protein DPMN_181471 [Dreissena polymorpha]|uniref:Uncharacterized protein n=1 Tax=Dreissena polymorpha TaxID=45954 RepID=A0A9D4DEK8_DREPO|nr:hypothetical protein DPMN_181471 [Dreissena polymorpha]
MDSEDEVECDNPTEIQEELQNKRFSKYCDMSSTSEWARSSNKKYIKHCTSRRPDTYNILQAARMGGTLLPKAFLSSGLNAFNTNRSVKLSLKNTSTRD